MILIWWQSTWIHASRTFRFANTNLPLLSSLDLQGSNFLHSKSQRLDNTYGFSDQTHDRGPGFVMEPPSRLEFSNSSGGWLDCSASGSPQPSIDWLSIDGTSIGDVGGIRRVLRNGTLVLLPFPAAAYRQDIHSTVYRCVATNRVGRIISRDVQVRAGKWGFLFRTANPSQARLSCIQLFLNNYFPVFMYFHLPLAVPSSFIPSPFIHAPFTSFSKCIDVEVNNHPIIKILEYHEISST